jgi:hypothetical protein
MLTVCVQARSEIAPPLQGAVDGKGRTVNVKVLIIATTSPKTATGKGEIDRPICRGS